MRPESRKNKITPSQQKLAGPDVNALHELLNALKKHVIDIPFERLGHILAEHQLLMEHRGLVNELAHEAGPSQIHTTISRQSKHERQS
ncbi:MAG: hypothetical protein GAK34_03921 [Delftia tsuruhatensis]|nr:MAG: hypothetical protein GAK34_03921 [Delftia tsuruhatensis]